MNNPALHSQVIINTRPRTQATELTQQLHQHGAKVIEFPTIKITWPKEKNDPSQWIQDLPSYNQIIMVSANAAQAVEPYWHTNSTPIICVGPATERSVNKFHAHTIKPNVYSSEGILQMPSLQNIQGHKILILCGSEHKTKLAESLRQRGATVDIKITYQVQDELTPDSATLATMTAHKINWIIITSSNSLSILHGWFNPTYRTWLTNTPLVVASENMLELAYSLGWEADKILLSKDPADQSILATLIEKA